MYKQISRWLPTSVLALSLCAPAAMAGFSVQGGKLVEGNGQPFVMRGVNHAHVWYKHTTPQALKDIASTGSNTVRIVLANGTGGLGGRVGGAELAQVIQWCKENKLIAVLEVHDATGYGDAASAENPLNTVNYWLSADIRSALNNQEDYVIINIANEPLGNNRAGEWTSLQTQSIQRMRQAGIKHTIMVDAPNWGQDWSNTMRNNAATVFNADSERNTVFSVHMYESYGNSTSVQSYLQDFKNKNLPLVVGEFGADHKGANVDEDSIMAASQQQGFGYLGWSWSGNNAETSSLDIVNNFNVNSLTSWGNRLINGANGIKQTSKLATIFGGQASSSSAPGATSVAFGKPASASSFESAEFDAAKAFDNNGATRWASALTAATASLSVDLGAYYDLTGVRLSWEAAYASGYSIQISSDNVNWSNVHTKTNGTGGVENINITGQGRYLRINMTTKANAAWGYSLWEVAVYSNGVTVPSSSAASSSAPSGSALSCPQGNSWPDCPQDTWSDSYCATLGQVCTRNSSSSLAPSSSSSSLSLTSSSSSSRQPSAPSCGQTPADLDSNIQAKNLLCYLKNNTFISGQTDMPDADRVLQWTGRYPAIIAFDFYRYTDGDTSETQKAIDFAKNRKGIVAFQWHWKCPRGGEYYTDCAFDQDLNNPNSKLYQDIDVVARELKKMGDAGVPVLFRPLHEANDNFMWWAKKGTDNYKRLWKLIYDRVNAQGVTNVLWVFNGMAGTGGYRSNMRDWYPGDNMVDAVTSDYYQSWADYNTLKAIGNNKIVGIAETFNALNPATEPPFSFSIVWAFRDCYRTQGQPSSGDVKGCENSWRTAMNNSRTISIDQLPDFSATNGSSSSAGPENLALGKTVVATSTEGAGYEAAKLVDGNAATRWASALTAASTSITVDLGGYYSVSGVRLQWEAAYASAYNIQISTDNVNFSNPIFSKNNGTGGVENVTLAGQGRYIRINMTGKANPSWGYSLWELSVFGEGATPASSTPAISSSAASSSVASSVSSVARSSVATSSSVSSSTASVAASQFTCTVTRTGSWSGGYQADVRVTNTGAAASRWTVYLNFAQNAQITGSWNATLSGNGTTRVSATNVGYNGSLARGASTTFGFTGNSGANFTLPGCSGTAN